MSTHEKLTKLLEGRIVDGIRQRGTELDIDFEDGSTLSVKLVSEYGSITVTAEDDKREYGN
jgi:hypothetical protein